MSVKSSDLSSHLHSDHKIPPSRSPELPRHRLYLQNLPPRELYHSAIWVTRSRSGPRMPQTTRTKTMHRAHPHRLRSHPALPLCQQTSRSRLEATVESCGPQQSLTKASSAVSRDRSGTRFAPHNSPRRAQTLRMRALRHLLQSVILGLFRCTRVTCLPMRRRSRLCSPGIPGTVETRVHSRC